MFNNEPMNHIIKVDDPNLAVVTAESLVVFQQMERKLGRVIECNLVRGMQHTLGNIAGLSMRDDMDREINKELLILAALTIAYMKALYTGELVDYPKESET